MKCGHGLVLGAQSGLLTLNIAQFPGRRFLIIDTRQKPQGTAGPQRARPDPSNPRRPACTSMSATGDVAPAPEDGRQNAPEASTPEASNGSGDDSSAVRTTPIQVLRIRHATRTIPCTRLSLHAGAPGHQGPELPVDPAGPRRRLAGTRRKPPRRAPRNPTPEASTPEDSTPEASTPEASTPEPGYRKIFLYI